MNGQDHLPAGIFADDRGLRIEDGAIVPDGWVARYFAPCRNQDGWAIRAGVVITAPKTGSREVRRVEP